MKGLSRVSLLLFVGCCCLSTLTHAKSTAPPVKPPGPIHVPTPGSNSYKTSKNSASSPSSSSTTPSHHVKKGASSTPSSSPGRAPLSAQDESILSSFDHEHVCNHAALAAEQAQFVKTDPQVKESHLMASERSGSTRSLSAIPGAQPIRLVGDFRAIAADGIRTCHNTSMSALIGNDPGGAPACDNTTTTDCYLACQDEHVLSSEQETWLRDTLFVAAAEFLSNALSLDPVVGNLTLSAGSCGTDVTVADDHVAYGSNNTDLLMYITARPSTGSTIASAIHCRVDSDGRPTAGHINFAPNKLSMDPDDAEKMVNVAIHEITHVLGFSPSLFDSWNVTGSVTTTTLENAPNGTPVNITRVVTPTVVEAARTHFGCPTLTGVALEDGGGVGTAGTHWEKRLFRDAVMSGSAGSYNVYTNITLALLQDTGWYEANFDMAQELIWGYQRGCDFVGGDCWDLNDWDEAGYACNEPLAVGCSYHRFSKASCQIKAYSSAIEDEYQPQAPFAANQGGLSSLMDYCPVWVPYTLYGDCSDPNSYFDGSESYGEEFGEGSLCFETSIVSKDSSIVLSDRVGCYESTCVGPDSLRVRVGDLWYHCDGTETEFTPLGYEGTMSCPARMDGLCIDAPVETEPWPVIESISPETVLSSQGSTFTLIGTNLDLIEFVWVSDISCTVESVSDDGTEVEVTLGDAEHLTSLGSVADLDVFAYEASQDSGPYMNHPRGAGLAAAVTLDPPNVLLDFFMSLWESYGPLVTEYWYAFAAGVGAFCLVCLKLMCCNGGGGSALPDTVEAMPRAGKAYQVGQVGGMTPQQQAYMQQQQAYMQQQQQQAYYMYNNAPPGRPHQGW